MARASLDGFFVWVSNANENPRLVEGVSGCEAGGLESMIEDSSSFCAQEMSDLIGMCELSERTFPELLKTAPLPALNRGQSGQEHHEISVLCLTRAPTFKRGHGCDSCIHSFSSLTEYRVTSSQSCFQCRPVQNLHFWRSHFPVHGPSTAMNNKSKLLSIV